MSEKARSSAGICIDLQRPSGTGCDIQCLQRRRVRITVGRQALLELKSAKGGSRACPYHPIGGAHIITQRVECTLRTRYIFGSQRT